MHENQKDIKHGNRMKYLFMDLNCLSDEDIADFQNHIEEVKFLQNEPIY